MSSSASSMRVWANLSRSSLTSSGVRVASTPRRLASRVSLAIFCTYSMGRLRNRSMALSSTPSRLEILTSPTAWTERGIAPFE